MKTSSLLGIVALLSSAVGCSAEEKSAVCTVNVASPDTEAVIELARQFSAAEGGRFNLVRHPGLVSFGYQAQRTEMVGSNPFEPREFQVHFYSHGGSDASEALGTCDRFLGVAVGNGLDASMRPADSSFVMPTMG